jgi:hypothetical protein
MRRFGRAGAAKRHSVAFTLIVFAGAGCDFGNFSRNTPSFNSASILSPSMASESVNARS